MSLPWSVPDLMASGAVAAALAWAATALLLPFLRDRALDVPNARSSHVAPTPRGGGLAILAVALPLWCVAAWWSGASAWPILLVVLAAAALAAVSWLDDRHSLPPWLRFGTHIGVVAIGIHALGTDRPAFGGVLPLVADRLLLGFGWVWFINLFNFMDGIDGIAGSETIAVCAGLIVLTALLGLDPLLGWQAAILLGAAAGFLVWNWAPARIFLGDVGSAPLGYLLGGLLAKLWLSGYAASAAILPLYFIADASVTLVRRIARRERVWEAHRDHFYQYAVRGGASHAAVTGLVILLNLVLLGLAILAARHPLGAFVAALAATAVVFLVFARRGRNGQGS